MPRRVARTDPPPEDEPAPPRPRPEAPDPATDPTAADDELAAPTTRTATDDERRAPGPVTNGELARIFHEIGDILEVKGEIPFKTVAYHRAADAIARAPFDVGAAYAAGDRRPIPGVGAAISDKIVELATTGRMAYYEKLRAEIPPTLVDLLRIPGVGPKTVRLAWEGLGIATLDDAPGRRRGGPAARAQGHQRRAPRHRILEGIDKLGRDRPGCYLHRAQRPVGRPGRGCWRARRASPGSCRRARSGAGARRSATSTSSSRPTLPKAVIERFVGLGVVDTVLGAGQAKAAITVQRGPQVDLMVMPPGEAGSYLVHFTGSADHNIRLRGLARDRGWSLSEKGFVRIGEDGQPLDLATPEADLRTFPDEAGVYRFLDLDWIPPELREDRGEIEAAREGRLPALITLADLRGDLHSHSEWSDGVHSIEVMAEAARRRGYAYQVLTDHSPEPGHRPAAWTRSAWSSSAVIIAALNARFAAEEAAGDGPRGRATRAGSASSTAASWRSAPTACWTTRTTCSPGSTSWWPRSTSPAASRARS